MSDTVQLLQGKNEVFFVRLLKDASTESAMLIPYLTSNSVNQSRSTTNTETKSGVVHAVGSLTTTLCIHLGICLAMSLTLFHKSWAFDTKMMNY